MKKSILITGTTSGIGASCIRKFSQEGYTVFAGYRSPKFLKELQEIHNVIPVKLDVTSSEDVENAYASIANHVGDNGLFAIINNAGITYTAPFEYANESKARNVMEVNLWAPYRISQKFIPLLKKHNTNNSVKARIINITSWAGILAGPFNSAYNASKFAIIGLTEAMVYDLGILDIYSVAASPGITKTPLLKKTTNAQQAYVDMPKEGTEFYRKYLDHMDSMADGSNDSKMLLTPERISEKLHKIVEKRKPKAKYNMAMDAKLMEGFMRKFVPFKWIVAMNKRMYKLNK